MIHAVDLLEAADLRRAELRDSFPCLRCKAPDPVRLGRNLQGTYGCSECLDFRRCGICGRWTLEETGLPARAVVIDGASTTLCTRCDDRDEDAA